MQTGHARTLQSASDPESLRLLKEFRQVASEKDEALTIDIDQQEIVVSSTVGSSIRDLELDWCFGSGTHARTWVGTLPDSWGERDLIEFRWSWYHETDDFDITPGQSLQKGTGYFAALGTLFDTPKARRCFSCHSTVLPQNEGRTDFQELHSGVTCQRCHGPRQAHVESEGEIQEGFWAAASQLESIQRCGECHRIAEDQKPEEITPGNPDIVRFQPVGLVQSPCFKNSPQLTCVTCHNPHQPLSMQNSSGIWQCVQCHDPQQDHHVLCSAGHRDNCLECHMPKVQVFENIQFTDHWIRMPDFSSETVN
ncbi:MAG: hypothetical protein HUJ26_20980 [Planctomycetaceae bacterium]|nr:hypothetical protein [Planctomycetaceae bacterium]